MKNPSANRSAGFTAIELMTVLAIVAILLTVVVPSFLGLTQKNRVAAKINGFVGDLQFARAEAIKQGQPVTICASTNGSACSGSATWETGWIIFADPDSNQTRNATGITEAVIRQQPAWSGTDTFRASSSVSSVTYSRDGFALGSTATVTFTLRTVPANADAIRCVTVNVSGKQQVLSNNGSSCV